MALEGVYTKLILYWQQSRTSFFFNVVHATQDIKRHEDNINPSVREASSKVDLRYL
jgi:hypothetical protein